MPNEAKKAKAIKNTLYIIYFFAKHVEKKVYKRRFSYYIKNLTCHQIS